MTPFDKWLQANGFAGVQGEALSDHQRGVLHALFLHRPETITRPHAKPKKGRNHRINASKTGPADKTNAELLLLCAATDLEIHAAEKADDGGDDKLPTFKMTAYTGGKMIVKGWYDPVVVELKGLRVSKRARPILLDHDSRAIVGHTNSIDVVNAKLFVEGVISGTGPAAAEVILSSKNGFPWRASIGARPSQVEFIGEGSTGEANGQEFKGPVYIARKATLGEVSFVAIAADDNTTVKVAATAGANKTEGSEESNMNAFDTWLKANGFDPAAITAEQRPTLEAAHKLTLPATPPTDPPLKIDATAKANEDEIRAAAVKEDRDRRAKIDAACKGIDGDQVNTMHAKAVSGDITLEELQTGLLRVVREQRPNPSQTAQQGEVQRNVLHAAALQLAGVGNDAIITICGEPAIEAAHSLRGIGIQEWCARAALIDGVELGRFQQDSHGWLQGAFSTMTVPNMLAAVANKLLLDGYNYVEQAWREVVKIRPVKDFKEHQRFRLTSDMKFLKVGKDGELKHGSVSEQKFTVQADTFGLMFSLTRQDIINDDLGAFTQVPTMLGMGAGEAIAEAVWTLILSNPSSFYKTANKNYATGATTALSIAGLTAAELLFLDQTKPNGRPLGIPPAKLVVPNALKVAAEQLMSSLKLTEGGGSSKSSVPTDNPHSGKFTVVPTAYLGNATITGHSVKAWYLFADPNRVASYEVAFLNGVDRPTVERSDADFNTLGVRFRGWVDFGTKEQDPRGSVKMKGEV